MPEHRRPVAVTRFVRAAALSALVSLCACEQVLPIGGPEGACVPAPVQAAFDRSCALGGCHDANGSGAGLVLTAGASSDVLGKTASQQALPLVTLGDAEHSYMASKLVADPPMPITGARMPVGFDPANADQARDVAIILGWINGASFTGCEPAGGSEGSSGGAIAEGTGSEGPIDEETTTGGVLGARELPCEIDELLDRRCRSCHSDPPQGAPMPLVTRDHLLASAPSDATLSVAERAAQRMADDAAPMPPAPGTRVAAQEIADFEAWLAAGTPTGECGGGGEDTTGGEPEPNPFDVDPVCSSGRFWDDDDDGDPRMHPGRDCIGCHTLEHEDHPGDEDIPDLVIAGTVFPTAHEPNDCISDGVVDLRVVVQSITSGDEVTLAPNTSGNFLLHRSEAPDGFAAPFTVKVVDGDRERIMPIPAPAGSCNGCHTQDGTMGAPGRVLAP